MARIKCPFCGSRNTAEILYGMPDFSDELEAAMDNGEIVLGGCCTTLNDPQMHCNDCGEDFGRSGFYPSRSEDKPGLIPCYISTIEFGIGGFFGGHYRVKFKATPDGADVHVKHYPYSPYDCDIDKEFHISQRRWENMIYKLVDQLYICEWEENYVDPHIIDGTQWRLTVKEGEVSLIECYGSNAYPPYWEELIQTLSYYSETRLS